MVDEITLIGMDDTLAMVQNPLLFGLQKEAVELYCRAQLKSNPKTTVGLSLMRQGFFGLFSEPSSDLDVILYFVQGLRPRGGTYDFYNGLVYTMLGGFLRYCLTKRILLFVAGPVCSDKPGMEYLGSWLKDKDTAVDVVWFPDTDPRSNTTDLLTTPVKKERLEAFVAAANNNNNSHIAYLEPGSDVRQVLTKSGILTPRRLSIKDKNKAAVIDGPENVIPMKMKSHHQTSSSGLAREDETASDGPENVIPNTNNNSKKKKKKKKNKNNNKNNQPLVHSEPQKTPLKTSQNDNMSHKGKDQVC